MCERCRKKKEKISPTTYLVVVVAQYVAAVAARCLVGVVETSAAAVQSRAAERWGAEAEGPTTERRWCWSLTAPVAAAAVADCNATIQIQVYIGNKSVQKHTRLMALYPALPGWAGTRKVKPIWILLKQETVSGSGIRCAICKSAPRSRQITMPALHHSVFLHDGCPSWRPTNSVKALKAIKVCRKL